MTYHIICYYALPDIEPPAADDSRAWISYAPKDGKEALWYVVEAANGSRVRHPLPFGSAYETPWGWVVRLVEAVSTVEPFAHRTTTLKRPIEHPLGRFNFVAAPTPKRILVQSGLRLHWVEMRTGESTEHSVPSISGKASRGVRDNHVTAMTPMVNESRAIVRIIASQIVPKPVAGYDDRRIGSTVAGAPEAVLSGRARWDRPNGKLRGTTAPSLWRFGSPPRGRPCDRCGGSGPARSSH